MRMKNSEKSGELNTILGKTSTFEGKIRVQHSLRVDGRVKGDIESTETLIIGKEGEVEGNVKVQILVIGGKLNGTVEAENKIVLEAKSELYGEIKTRKLIIDEGATFDGKCTMTDDAKTEHKSASLLPKSESEETDSF
jgi:cytoskeletal protein CcmA (bactofilin family)